MLTEEPSSNSPPAERVNVADRLAVHAAERPDDVAVVEHRVSRTSPTRITFAALDRNATQLARGLVAMGVRPGHRIALLVKPGVEFVTLVFALLRSGATMVLVDGGLGRKNIVRCLESTTPDGFIAIPQGHALRVLMRKKFPQARFNVTVGRRWFWGGETLDTLRKLGSESPAPSPQPPATLPLTAANDPAAIVFTSGSTGPPKGVVYRHETFTTQCDEIQREYDLQPGAIDLACFPLFGLFNVACGITTVLPEMDFPRPASCDPKKLFAAANDWQVTQSFASPAVWDKLSRHAEKTGEKIPTLQKAFSCGAPVPAKVIERTLAMVHPDAQLHTPYGATESLPVATIEAQEILTETATKTDQGAGVCVGRKFESIEWRVIKISDDPIATIDQTEELPTGEIGELIVRGPQVSRSYLANDEALMTNDEERPAGSSFVIHHSSFHNRLAKITEGETIWHRMGDVGYLDDQGRFWYCGRKSQRVVTSEGALFTSQVESIVNQCKFVKRSALVGVGPADEQLPVLIYESVRDVDLDLRLVITRITLESYPDDLTYPKGVAIPALDDWEQEQVARFAHRHLPIDFGECCFRYRKLPTDIRHNSKIRREELAEWAAKQLRKREH